MSLNRRIAGIFSVGLMVLSVGVVFGQATSTGSGQAYPNKPIRIVTSPCCGGGGDFSTRVIAENLSGPLGQQVIVDNRPTNLGPELNFASGSPGGANQRAAALFGYLAGVNIALISYKGSAQSITDLLSGVVHLTFETGGLVMPHVKLGKLRALGVTSAQPSALYPGMPTVASSLPGYESLVTTAMWAPAKTPAAIISRINQEVVRALSRPEVKEIFLNNGLEPVGSSPDELSAIVKSELAQMTKLIKEAGLKVE